MLIDDMSSHLLLSSAKFTELWWTKKGESRQEMEQTLTVIFSSLKDEMKKI